jgi:hypothetical protein
MFQSAMRVILRALEEPDEVPRMRKGRYEVVRISGQVLGQATYEPCWRWSEHVGPSVGATRCGVEHLALVLAGPATAAFDDGSISELRQGTSSSILRQCRMTAGSSEPSHTWRFIFSAPTGTPSRLDDGNERDAVDECALGAP